MSFVFVFVLTDCDGAADEMPELSDGDDDGDDEEQWQWMEEDSQQVPCLFCDRWDDSALPEEKLQQAESYFFI